MEHAQNVGFDHSTAKKVNGNYKPPDLQAEQAARCIQTATKQYLINIDDLKTHNRSLNEEIFYLKNTIDEQTARIVALERRLQQNKQGLDFVKHSPDNPNKSNQDAVFISPVSDTERSHSSPIVAPAAEETLSGMSDYVSPRTSTSPVHKQDNIFEYHKDEFNLKKPENLPYSQYVDLDQNNIKYQSYEEPLVPESMSGNVKQFVNSSRNHSRSSTSSPFQFYNQGLKINDYNKLPGMTTDSLSPVLNEIGHAIDASFDFETNSIEESLENISTHSVHNISLSGPLSSEVTSPNGHILKLGNKPSILPISLETASLHGHMSDTEAHSPHSFSKSEHKSPVNSLKSIWTNASNQELSSQSLQGQQQNFNQMSNKRVFGNIPTSGSPTLSPGRSYFPNITKQNLSQSIFLANINKIKSANANKSLDITNDLLNQLSIDDKNQFLHNTNSKQNLYNPDTIPTNIVRSESTPTFKNSSLYFNESNQTKIIDAKQRLSSLNPSLNDGVHGDDSSLQDDNYYDDQLQHVSDMRLMSTHQNEPQSYHFDNIHPYSVPSFDVQHNIDSNVQGDISYNNNNNGALLNENPALNINQNVGNDSRISNNPNIKPQISNNNLDTNPINYQQQQVALMMSSITSNPQYLVDKIVKTNDQPASLLLQQQLKYADSISKTIIFDAILSQSVDLMKNRFGNFLMQRVIEFGTFDQIKILIESMKGHILSLSYDRFGCHVIQKAVECTNDEIRMIILDELFPYIKETVMHKFSCHVWQRVFQIKWDNGLPPIIMINMHKTLMGMWDTVASDENGSLVVQCIFENSTEEEKRPILDSVLKRTIDIALGQWGNWVIQHIIEQGSEKDRNFVIKSLISHFYILSIDQYASKVIEKGLKTAPDYELKEMISKVLEPDPRTRNFPPLLEMMNNQYANYVVQHILHLAEPNQKEICIKLILPHLNTLRTSKFGQRVAIIAEKYARQMQII